MAPWVLFLSPRVEGEDHLPQPSSDCPPTHTQRDKCIFKVCFSHILLSIKNNRKIAVGNDQPSSVLEYSIVRQRVLTQGLSRVSIVR